jgi:hypothetical protein
VRAGLCAALWLLALAARGAPADLVIEAELEPGRVYVGAEAILLLRLMRAPGVAYGALRPPSLGDAAGVFPLARPRWYQVQREGMTWQVQERAYRIVPRHAGRLAVPGAELEGPLRFSDAAKGARAPRRVLEVLPQPALAPEPWLPARRLALEESWSRDPAALSAGTPVTRTLMLRAEGIPAERLPQLEMAPQAALRAHHDQPELATEYRITGTIGRRVQRIALIPLDEGEIVLPALSVHWWDVEAHTPRSATLAPRTLRLQAPPARTVRADPADESPLARLRELAAAFAALLIGLLWWRARTEPQREARMRLRAACRRDDARGARGALLEWWSAMCREAPPPLLQRIGASWDAAARAELDALDAALYGGRAWDGKTFWRRVRPWLRRTPARRRARTSQLATLFRLQAGP